MNEVSLMATDYITDFEELMLLDEAAMARRYDIYRHAREAGPIFWSERLQRWYCTHFVLVRDGLRDPRLSNENPPAFLRQLPDDVRATLSLENPLFRQFHKIMMSRDDPDHARLRALVNNAFTPRSIEQQRPLMERLTRDLLVAMETMEQPDFIRDFAIPFPIMVIARMIGIPYEDLGQIKHWSDMGADFLASAGDSTELLMNTAAIALEFNAFLHPHLEARRRQPQDDLLSALIQAEAQGDRLDEDELIANVFLLLAAGNETTTNLLGNSLWTLLNHRDQLDLLRAQPGLIEAAVEEMLRYESPSQLSGRRVKDDMVLAGQRVSADATVVFMIGAANRDPAQFADPESFLIARKDNKHIAFGMGPHYCLGAPLARLEAQVTLPILLDTYPALRLANESEPARWRKNPTFLGLEQVPIRLA